MDTSFALRIDAHGKRWDGNSSPQGDKQQRRRQKLQALLQTLKAGDLDILFISSLQKIIIDSF